MTHYCLCDDVNFFPTFPRHLHPQTIISSRCQNNVTRAESTVSSALDSRKVLSRRRGYLDLGSQLISTNRQRLARSERDRRIRMQTSLACYGGYPIAFHLFIASSNSPASPPLVTSMPTKYSNSDQGRIIESSWNAGFYL